MDLSRLEMRDADQATMTVMDPRDRARPLMNGDGRPMTLTMLGLDSPKVRETNRRIQAKRLLDRTLANIVTVDDGLAALKSQENRDIDTVSAAVIGWDGLGLDEDETPFSEEKCREAFRRLPWLYEQANMFLGNRANFLKGSARS